MAELKKVLGFPAILLITINSILGTGIFFLPAVGVSIAGPASIISWVILSIVCIYISMCFGELCSMFPTSGGVYEYCKQAFGRFPSFMVGWTTILAGNITIAMLIVGAIQYLFPFVGALPLLGTTIPASFIKIFICLLFVFIFNYVAFKGMQTSAVMLVAFSFITLGTILGLTIPGLINFSLSNLSPFFVFPISATFVAIFFIAETFFGWETATFLAEETKNAKIVMPRALIIGTIIMAVVSLFFVVTSLSSMPWELFGKSVAPLSDLANIHYGGTGVYVFTLLVYLAIIGSVAGWIVSAPRLTLALAKDKLFPGHLAKIHEKNQTPYTAIIFQTILTSILVILGFGSYKTLLLLLLPMLLFMYSFVLMSLVILRYKRPELERPYKAPFGKVGPILVIFFLMFLMIMWLTNEQGAFASFNLGLSFIAIGIPIYFLIEMYYDPKAIQKTKDLFAFGNLMIEWLVVPKKIRKQIIQLVGDVKGKTVLEFGCSVGTLTMHLAEEVGPTGKIYATDLSLKELEITQKRIDKKKHNHIRLIHDDQHHNRVHPLIPNVDVIVSIGMMGYVQDLPKVLKEMYQRLPSGGRICLVDYDKFFGFMPNVEWLNNNDKIKEFFKQNGFSVRVMRKSGILWQYVFVYGVKFEEGVVPYI